MTAAIFALVLAVTPANDPGAFPAATSRPIPCGDAVRSGDDKAAIGCLEAILAKDPADADAGNTLAAVYVREKKYAKALSTFDAVVAKHPRDAVALNGRAVSLFALKRIEDGFAALEAAIKLDPDNAQAVGNLGRMGLTYGKIDVAENCYRHVIEKHPDDEAAHLGMGEVRLAQGRIDEAITELTRAVELDEKDARANWMLGKALAQDHPIEGAKYLGRATKLAPDDADVWYDLGLALFAADETMAAGDAFVKAGTLAPDDPHPYLQLGKVYLQLGRYSDAEKHFAVARRHKPSKEDLANIEFQTGILLEREARPRDAEASYRAALAAKKDLVPAMINLGVLAMQQKKWKDAAAHFRDAVKVAPTDPAAHFDLGLALIALGDDVAGKSELAKAVQLLPAGNALRQRAAELIEGKKSVVPGAEAPVPAEKKSERPDLGPGQHR